MQQDVEEAALDLVNMLQDDIAPKSWWAVLLCDAVTLLQSAHHQFLALCPSN